MKQHSCRQGRDCPLRRMAPYPNTISDELPACECRDPGGPDDVEIIIGMTVVGMLVVAFVVMSVWAILEIT